MKKIIFSFSFILGATAFAQNVTPTLEVEGNVKVDSCVIVKDSIIIDKNARIKGDEKIEGSLYVGNNVVGNKNLEISKNATISKDVTVGRNITVDNKIIAPNLPSANNMNNKEVVVKTQNGTLKTIPVGTIALDMYSPIACPQDQDGNPIILPPTWSNGPSKIYTGTSACTGYVKVGIGEDDPQSRLEIKVASNIETAPLNIKNEAGDIVTVDRTGGLVVTSNLLQNDEPGNKKVLTINHLNNNLFQVHANGLTRAREIKVDLEQWPDYVFEKNYVLMPLSEVEEYINENGHLPNVPSAEEVEKEGQNLGEMNKILMEKVEELTLHLIRQQKEIEELKKKVEEKETKK